MFCTKCGTQNPDTSDFCTKCGSPLQAQPVQPVQQAPQMPQLQQSAYGVPIYQQPKKSNALPIVIAVCATVLIAFFAVLFAVIIPNSNKAGGAESDVSGSVNNGVGGGNVNNTENDGGIEGKLAHRWSMGGDSYLDLKNNIYSEGSDTLSLDWQVKGGNRLCFWLYWGDGNQPEEWEYLFTLSADGKTLICIEPDDPSITFEFRRAD